jgi:hypothetical protein
MFEINPTSEHDSVPVGFIIPCPINTILPYPILHQLPALAFVNAE